LQDITGWIVDHIVMLIYRNRVPPKVIVMIPLSEKNLNLFVIVAGRTMALALPDGTEPL